MNKYIISKLKCKHTIQSIYSYLISENINKNRVYPVSGSGFINKK